VVELVTLLDETLIDVVYTEVCVIVERDRPHVAKELFG
jgi:hypothetical protein